MSIPQPSKRRRYDEDTPTGPRKKDGLAAALENAMRMIFQIHRPDDLDNIYHKGWKKLTTKTEAAMKARGFMPPAGKSWDAHSAIQRFWNGYKGFAMRGEIVLGLSDALGLTGRLRHAFISYGLLLRGQEDTRQLMYAHLVAERCIPAIKTVATAYEAHQRKHKTPEHIAAYIQPFSATNTSPPA